MAASKLGKGGGGVVESNWYQKELVKQNTNIWIFMQQHPQLIHFTNSVI